MINSWKSREFDCDGKRWTVVRHVRAVSDTAVDAPGPAMKQTGLYFHNGEAVRVLAYTLDALPRGADLRLMSDEALRTLLRRSLPLH
jgi:hypothetical protein